MSQVVMICILLFIAIAGARAATLTVAFDTPGISISPSERNRLLQHVAAIKGTDIKLADVSETTSADILLTTRDAIPGWQNNLLVGSLKFGQLVRLELDGEKVSHEERIMIGQRIRDVRQGPDGAVYLLTDQADGQLLRLRAASN